MLHGRTGRTARRQQVVIKAVLPHAAVRDIGPAPVCVQQVAPVIALVAPRRPRRRIPAATAARAVGRPRTAVRAGRTQGALLPLARVLTGRTGNARSRHVSSVGASRTARAHGRASRAVRPGFTRHTHRPSSGAHHQRESTSRAQRAVGLVEARRVAARRARGARGGSIVVAEARVALLPRGRARRHRGRHARARPRRGLGARLRGRSARRHYRRLHAGHAGGLHSRHAARLPRRLRGLARGPARGLSRRRRWLAGRLT